MALNVRYFKATIIISISTHKLILPVIYSRSEAIEVFWEATMGFRVYCVTVQ